MTTVQVVVESISANSKTCELDEELIIRSIMYPFSSAKFKAVDDQNDKDVMARLRGLFKDQQSRIAAIYASEQRGDTTPEDAAKQMQAINDEYEKEFADIDRELTQLVFYVNVLSLYSDATNLCVSSIDAEAKVYQNVNLEATGKSVLAEIKLWSAGRIIGSNRERHRQLLSQGIEELAKQFVTAWNLDNQGGETKSKALTFDEFRKPGPDDMERQRAPKPDAKTEPEVVTVKYRGLVSLAPFKCDAVTRSSFIERMCYDAANSYMLIDLSGTWYHYCEIDADTVSNLMAADSMGQFYNQSIKGRFDCRTHRVPQY